MRHWLALLGFFAILCGPATAQSLMDLEGKPHTVAELAAQPDVDALVLVVWCSRCASCRGVERDLADYSAQGGPRMRLYAVDPHPADSAERIKSFLVGQNIDLRVLRDHDQLLIDALKINKTTTALVYDKSGKLRYIGPFKGDGKGYARDAVDEVLAGHEVSLKSRPLKG